MHSQLGLFKTSAPSHRFLSSLSTTNIGIKHLLAKADALRRQGSIRAAEATYKTAIEKFPTNETAYQRLWNSWVTHRSLKVSQSELDDFIDNYSKHILLNNTPPLKFRFFIDETRLHNNGDAIEAKRETGINIHDNSVSVTVAHVGYLKKSNKVICEYRVRYGLDRQMKKLIFSELNEKLELGVKVVNEFDDEMSSLEQSFGSKAIDDNSYVPSNGN